MREGEHTLRSRLQVCRHRQIETPQEYVLLDPDRILVECYRRNERDNWKLVTTVGEVSGVAAEDSLFLDSIGLDIALPQVYEDQANRAL
ncbi:Uma2 family endonuclease [Nodosilinea sp. LEGE 06152]|uniref:Uma2 family endonuclease n=1 Tax=Nodosilinea sp. LEGE 06152 TaxID=2777966 RepID=UPI00187F6C34|nr:Uma2 family endonuclease [Nodosilinea sp. LEGE 06152]MBE9156526.1 Uma2 family endonuclease [Nodosilinea sp. LEGE 06152]